MYICTYIHIYIYIYTYIYIGTGVLRRDALFLAHRPPIHSKANLPPLDEGQSASKSFLRVKTTDKRKTSPNKVSSSSPLHVLVLVSLHTLYGAQGLLASNH
jgi:hypothetical protein